MNIQLNGTEFATTSATLAGVLKEAGFAQAVVATAVNGSFVPQGARASQPIQAGDLVEVLAPMQGG